MLAVILVSDSFYLHHLLACFLHTAGRWGLWLADKHQQTSYHCCSQTYREWADKLSNNWPLSTGSVLAWKRCSQCNMTPLGSVGLQGLPRHGWNTDQLHRALSSYPHRTCRYSATLICLTTKHPFQINNCLVGTGLISSLEQDPPPISPSPFLLL